MSSSVEVKEQFEVVVCECNNCKSKVPVKLRTRFGASRGSRGECVFFTCPVCKCSNFAYSN